MTIVTFLDVHYMTAILRGGIRNDKGDSAAFNGKAGQRIVNEYLRSTFQDGEAGACGWTHAAVCTGC